MSKSEKYMLRLNMKRNMTKGEKMVDCRCQMGKTVQYGICVICIESRARMIMSDAELADLAEIGFK